MSAATALRVWQAGLAGTSYPTVTAAPFYANTSTYWLSSSGSDSTGTADTPELPFLTLNKLITTTPVGAGSTIFVPAGFVETLAAAQVVPAGVHIIGSGTGSSRPRFTCANSVAAFTMSGAGACLENLFLPASTVTPAAKVDISAAGVSLLSCYVECGAYDHTIPGVSISSGGNYALIEDTTFASVASQPGKAIASTAVANDLHINGCTFSGGAFGWSSDAIRIATGAMTRLVIRDVTLTGNSDIAIAITGSTCKIFGVTASGASRIYALE